MQFIQSGYSILTGLLWERQFLGNQAPVVQTINNYRLDIAIGFAITYPVDSDLSGG